MATISVHTFQGGEADRPKDGYLDIWFVDHSPNALRRLWLLTLDLDAVPWAVSAELRRSDTSEGDFGYSVAAPRRMAAALLAAAIRDGLIPRHS